MCDDSPALHVTSPDRRPEADASRLASLGRALEPAAPAGDILDLLAVGAGVKPMAAVAACYTASGAPAWGTVSDGSAALSRDTLGDRLDELALEWHLQPVETVREDGFTVTWYELLCGPEGVSAFVERTGPLPGDRSQREYGRALGYPPSAVEWFVGTEEADRSVFDVIRTDGRGERSVTLAASVPYVPAPTPQGAVDAVGDGRRLTEALGRLDAAAGDDFAEELLGERIDTTLTEYDAGVTTRWRDPLHRAMHSGSRTPV
jgi:hypothetical protein